VVISRFGAMFFADPVAAFRNIAAATKRGGRLAMLAWQRLEHQYWLQQFRAALAIGRELPGETPDARGPFGLATEDHVRRVLGEAGWSDITLDEVREPMYFGADAEAAFAMLRGIGLVRGLSQGLDERGKQQALDALHETLRRHDTPEGVLLDSRAWLITARRR
jgi:hypothetical protein